MDENPYKPPQEEGGRRSPRRRFSPLWFAVVLLLIGALALGLMLYAEWIGMGWIRDG